MTFDTDTLIASLCSSEFNQISFQRTVEDRFDRSAQKIAVFATNEFEGFSKNGGIGTYYTTLSQKLADDGWCVILLLCQSDHDYGGQPYPPHLDHIFSTGEVDRILNLQPIHQAILAQSKIGSNPWFDLESWRCSFLIQAIATTFPDAVIYAEFPAIWGFGCRTIQAKNTGVLGSSCFIGVTDHGGFEWLRETNSRYFIEFLRWSWQAYHYDQYSYDHANLTCFPSYFLRSKVESYGWNVNHAVHLPYFIPLVQPPATSELSTIEPFSQIDSGKIPIVFFGRLEERKGLCTFVKALQTLKATDLEWFDRIRILFFGRIMPLESTELLGLNSQQYIDRELNGIVDYQICPSLSSQEAITIVAHLTAPVVCLCSLQENFPNAALEMGQLPVSLVVADTGGFRETLDLVTRADGVRWFTPDDHHSLAKTLAAAIAVYPETPAVPDRTALAQINHQLLNQRLELMTEAFLAVAPQEIPNPRVTVGIPCFADEDKLADCLESLAGQTYQNLEVIVLYNTTANADAQQAIAQSQTQFSHYQFIGLEFANNLGSAYNQLVNRATGDFFLPFTPDRIALPHAIATFVQAASEAEAVIVTSPDMTLSEDDLEVITFVDGSLLKLLEFEQTRDLGALFSVAWLKSFPYCEERGLRALNWTLLAAAIAMGQAIAYYPYPLYLSDRHSALVISPETFPKERYYLRHVLSQIEPAQWTQRQLYLVLTCIEQLWQAETANQQKKSQEQFNLKIQAAEMANQQKKLQEQLDLKIQEIEAARTETQRNRDSLQQVQEQSKTQIKALQAQLAEAQKQLQEAKEALLANDRQQAQDRENTQADQTEDWKLRSLQLQKSLDMF